MKKPRIDPDWKQSWKWFSMQSMMIASALQGAWVFLPEDLRSSLDGTLVSGLSLAILLLGIVGRLVVQDERRSGMSRRLQRTWWQRIPVGTKLAFLMIAVMLLAAIYFIRFH